MPVSGVGDAGQASQNLPLEETDSTGDGDVNEGCSNVRVHLSGRLQVDASVAPQAGGGGGYPFFLGVNLKSSVIVPADSTLSAQMSEEVLCRVSRDLPEALDAAVQRAMITTTQRALEEISCSQDGVSPRPIVTRQPSAVFAAPQVAAQEDGSEPDKSASHCRPFWLCWGRSPQGDNDARVIAETSFK